jgi:hypothetical protein
LTFQAAKYNVIVKMLILAVHGQKSGFIGNQRSEYGSAAAQSLPKFAANGF